VNRSTLWAQEKRPATGGWSLAFADWAGERGLRYEERVGGNQPDLLLTYSNARGVPDDDLDCVQFATHGGTIDCAHGYVSATALGEQCRVRFTRHEAESGTTTSPS
jgi:hypothetical protein